MPWNYSTLHLEPHCNQRMPLSSCDGGAWEQVTDSFPKFSAEAVKFAPVNLADSELVQALPGSARRNSEQRHQATSMEPYKKYRRRKSRPESYGIPRRRKECFIVRSRSVKRRTVRGRWRRGRTPTRSCPD